MKKTEDGNISETIIMLFPMIVPILISITVVAVIIVGIFGLKLINVTWKYNFPKEPTVDSCLNLEKITETENCENIY